MNTTEQHQPFWPGTKVRKSTHTGFTLGFLGKPHGFIPKATTQPGKEPDKRGTRSTRALRAFGNLNGSMPDLGVKKFA